MALFRALESVGPRATRLFDDPFAARFLGTAGRLVVGLARLPGGHALVTSIIERRWPGPLAMGILRTRYIDDALGAALGRGVRQVVVLGAGFDSRAYRVFGVERTAVFEVDHPATQATKQRRVAAILGALPPHVVFVPIDFNRMRLSDAMAEAGFRADRPTFVVWEGVTNYLSAEAVDGTLRYLATAGTPGSEILFTYVHRGILDGTADFPEAGAWMEAVKRVGEPFTFGFDPAELPAYLAARGLELVDDVGAPEYRERYLRPRGREMQLSGLYRAARARIAG